MRVSFEEMFDSVELLAEARTAKSFESNERLNSAYANMLKVIRRGYKAANASAKHRVVQIMLDTLYDESMGDNLDAGVDESVIESRIDEILEKWYDDEKWANDVGAEDEMIPDNKIRKAAGKIQSYLTWKYMGPPVRKFFMPDGSAVTTKDKRNAQARLEQTLKAFIADNPIKDDSEIYDIGAEAKAVIDKANKVGASNVSADEYQNTEVARLYEILENITPSSRRKGVENVIQKDSGISRLRAQQLAAIVTPKILRPYNVLRMKMFKNQISADPSITISSDNPKYVDIIISAINGTLEDKKELSPDNVKTSQAGNMSEDEALLRTKESTILDLRRSYENLSGDGDLTPEQFEKSVSRIVHNEKMPESLRVYMASLFDTVSYTPIGDVKSSVAAYDGFITDLLTRVLSKVTDDERKAFDEYYVKVYAPQNKRKLEKLNKTLIKMGSDAALAKDPMNANYPTMQKNMTKKTEFLAELDKLNHQIQRLGKELKTADPATKAIISSEMDTLLTHRDFVEQTLSFMGTHLTKHIEESNVIDYMCEQVVRDSRTHIIGEFKDRGYRKPVNYSEYMDRC